MNLLAHALFALALHSALWTVVAPPPLSEYGFLAAVVALLPDLDRGAGDGPSPWGHSVGYAVLWSLLALPALALLPLVPGLPSLALLPALVAVLTGLWSHLLLDGLEAPGILGLPRGGRWSRLGLRLRAGGRLSVAVSAGAAALLLLLLALR